MTVGSCSSPARIFAGSPGSSCCSPKSSIDTRISVGRIVARRRTRYSSIDEGAVGRRDCGAAGGRSGRHLQTVETQQAVGHVANAAELGAVGPQPVAVVQIDDRPLLQHPRGDLLVDLL